MIRKISSNVTRQKRHLRIRKIIQGSAERPRLSVYRSNTAIYVQLIDDLAQTTLVSVRSQELGLKHSNIETGKAAEVPDAIKKAVEQAKTNLINVPIVGTTIPHQITGHYGAGQVFLKPASEGTGIIAGGAVRAVFELAGINDILSKSIGSSTPINMVRATFAGLQELRTAEKVAALRGVDVSELV